MFELLDEIKSQWEESKFVLLHDNISEIPTTHICIPSQSVQSHHINFIRNYAKGPIFGNMPHTLFRQLGIPYLGVLLEGVAARYPIISQIKDKGDDYRTISIKHKNTTESNRASELATTLRNLGDFVDNCDNQSISESTIKSEFAGLFRIPGHIQLFRPIHSLLKRRGTISEFSLSLAELSNQARSVTTAEVLTEDGKLFDEAMSQTFSRDHDIPLIDYKTIFNLWRSMEKISKEEILWEY